MDIILASTSPRRIELLSWLGVPYQAVPSHLDEKSIRHADPARLTQLLAEAKAKSIAHQYPGAIIIGSDTVVSFNGAILEKPQHASEQRTMLREQRGQQGEVISSITLINTLTGASATRTKVTPYRLADFTDEQLESYIISRQGLDKAGGFGLQDEDGMFIGELDGCYTNALGFPLCEAKALLAEFGVAAPVDIHALVLRQTGRAC